MQAMQGYGLRQVLQRKRLPVYLGQKQIGLKLGQRHVKGAPRFQITGDDCTERPENGTGVENAIRQRWSLSRSIGRRSN